MIPATGLSDRFWRIVFAEHADTLLAGARHPEGRFHHEGQPVLYLSPTPQAAGFAIDAYLSADNRPRQLIPLDIRGARVCDLRDRATCAALGIDPVWPSAPWLPERAQGLPATSWRASDAVRAAGSDGMIYASRTQPSRWHLVLFRWNERVGPKVEKAGPGSAFPPKQ